MSLQLTESARSIDESSPAHAAATSPSGRHCPAPLPMAVTPMSPRHPSGVGAGRDNYYEVVGAGSIEVNGWYRPAELRQYRGVQPYEHVENRQLVLVRWHRERWVIIDMGEDRRHFPESSGAIEYYTSPSGDGTPPTGGFVAVVGLEPAPQIWRGSSLDRF